jgi:protein phosphatase
MTSAEQANLRVAAKSHPGMSGKNNEDRFAVSTFQFKSPKPISALLAIVADGIGGHRAGEVAAEIAVKTINQAVTAGDASQPERILGEAIVLAGQAIFSQSEIDQEQKGMGATCACCLVVAGRLYTASVGDSRIYLIRRESIQQLSTDHTWVQEAIENGALTPDEARSHPNAHVIRRYLGSRQPVVPDLRLRLKPGESNDQAESNQGLRLLPGDQLVICSDGLTDLVDQEEILARMKIRPLELAVDEMINLANQRGGHDNITIVTLEMPAPAVPVSRPRRLGWACLGIGGAILVIGVVLAGGLIWILNRPVPTQSPGMMPDVANTAQAIPSQPGLSGTNISPATSASRPAVEPGASPSPGLRTSPGPTPLSATLTPWPTNTGSP